MRWREVVYKFWREELYEKSKQTDIAAATEHWSTSSRHVV